MLDATFFVIFKHCALFIFDSQSLNNCSLLIFLGGKILIWLNRIFEDGMLKSRCMIHFDGNNTVCIAQFVQYGGGESKSVN